MWRMGAASVFVVSLVACSGPRLDKSIPEADAVDPARTADFSARFPLATRSQLSALGSPSHYLIVPGTDGQPQTGAVGAGSSSAGAADDDGPATSAAGIEINLDGAD